MQSKFPHLGTTIFLEMSHLAQKHEDINLSQGFPNFLPDKNLIDFTEKAFRTDKNQYAPMAGLPELRQKIAEKISQLYNRHYNWQS